MRLLELITQLHLYILFSRRCIGVWGRHFPMSPSAHGHVYCVTLCVYQIYH